MLKKIRRRFIVSAMAALGAVCLILIVSINCANFFRGEADEDRVIDMLIQYEQAMLTFPNTDFPALNDIPGTGGNEAEFSTRFFTVHYNSQSKVSVVSRDHIASVSYSDAVKYSNEVLSKGADRGYFKDYRYRISKTPDCITVLFLNISNDRSFRSSLLWTSIVIGLFGMGLVFVLLLLFSGKAIRPYVLNIERQKQFITDAGHELKTPITSISTSADILAMELEDNEWLENISKQTLRLGKLVNELVLLSRFDEGSPYQEKELFSISETAWEILQPFAARARAKGLSFSQDIEEGLSFRGNPSAIGQMLSVLLDNAVKYCSDGGSISFSLFKRRSKICIELLNSCTLPDIPDLNRLFDRFYRPDTSRSKETGGNGIGLSVAQAVVLSHGGSISAQAVGDRKILFKVLL